MRTISQVAQLTGISVRTLQYYDEIGILKPSELTPSGYRLYDDEALQKLQQILFFKELGFRLKEIDQILQKPDFDKIAAFKKQKELLLLKRNRIDRLVQLLSRLEKGEECMSFKEFDLTDYIEALENFKNTSTDDVIRHWGSVENFDLVIQKVKDDESALAKLAITHYGSVEKFTETMKYNLEHFSELMDKQLAAVKEVASQSDSLYAKLTSDLSADVSSEKVQDFVQEIVDYIEGHAAAASHPLDPSFLDSIIHIYSSNDYIKRITDTKHGKGASDYIANAFRCYLEKRHA